MPEQLKIIIDADVNKAIAGVQNLSKVITSDFVKATNTAAAAASKLSDQVNASVQKINASLSGLKVTSLDVTVNTSSIDASIKSIQSKFNALVDPELNVFANTAQAEAKIKELIAELSTLKGSEIFIRANDTQALKAINEIEAELNSLVGKQINLTVTADLAKLEELKAKIAALKVTPINVTVNTSALDGSIKSIQSKFAALIDPEINVLANTEAAEVKIKELLADLHSLRGSELFIKANDVNARKVIDDLIIEINSLRDNQIKLNVNTSEAIQKLTLLEKELLDFQNLALDPKISTTQLALFEKNIARIKAEIIGLKGQGISIPITANTTPAEANINRLSRTIEQLKARIQTISSKILVETDITKVVAYNKELDKLEAQMKLIQNVGKKGFELFVVPNQTINSVKNLTASVAAFGGGIKTFIPPAISAFNRFPSVLSPIVRSTNSASQAMLNFGRVLQDAPFGILGIANNINPLLESLQRASAAAKETGTSLSKNLLGALVGPAGLGLAVSAVSSLLIVFGDKLFGASKALSAAEIEARKFTASIADIKVGIDAFFANLDFEQNINKLKNRLKFGDAAEIFNIGLDKQSAEAIVQDTNEEITKASNRIADLVNRRAVLLSKSGQNLAEAFFSSLQTGVTVDTEGLSKADTKIFNILNEQATRIAALTEQNTKARRKSAEADVQIEIQKAADLKKALEKQKDLFEKFQNDIISKAQQFKKQFGDAFVLPELEVSFFTSKEQVFKNALKVLSDVKFDLSKAAALSKLEIKLPVLFTTETRLDDSDLKKFLRGEITRDQVKEIKVTVPVITDFDIQFAQPLAKEFEITKDLIDNFFKNVGVEIGVPVELNLDPSLSKDSIDKINKKLDLRGQFQVLGDLGLKEFEKIDFSNIIEGIAEATKRLQGMMEIALTLNQAIGQGLVNAFNAAFDAVLEGKSVFKALGEAIKQLVIGTIKAIAQMLILRLVTNAIFPGGGGLIGGFGGGLGGAIGGVANFGTGGIGSSAFSNVIQIVGTSTISGSDIVLTYNRSSNSSGRFG